MGEGRANVLLVVTDQQRGDALGLDGHAVLETPAMDWIGASGRISGGDTRSVRRAFRRGGC